MTGDPSSERRLLGDFVRAQRERLTPEEVGLPRTARRRTSGLRREEAALLCGVSATWLTWIEQGRAVSMSASALGRLASALRLDPAQRAYLFNLASRRDPDAPEVAGALEPPAEIAAAVRAVETPAYGLDPRWDRCAWNGAAARLFAAWLTGPEPNLLRYIFLAEDARRLICDWDDRARRVLAEFRTDYSRRLHDPAMKALVSDLTDQSLEFARWWDEHAVLAREGGLRRFQHPEDGLTAFRQHTFSPASSPDHKLVLLTPEAP